MIINGSKVKTEALLLFCRDLINSYEQNNTSLFNISDEIDQFIRQRIHQLTVAINIVVQPIDYYLRNKQVSRIMMILKTYEFINKEISKQFKQNDQFNPSMLCFTLLSTWFAELSVLQNDKEFLYFSRYPYSEIYDTLLLNVENKAYRDLNIVMLTIAENTIYKLNNYKFK